MNEQPTLRDQFAMAALTGMCAAPVDCYSGTKAEIARWAYEQADAMLKAREPKEQP